jgi:hypothetical protein
MNRGHTYQTGNLDENSREIRESEDIGERGER